MNTNVSADDYAEAGPAYARAHDRLRLSCTYPPSFEVFQHELRQQQKTRDNVTPDTLATQLAASYQRIPFNFPRS